MMIAYLTVAFVECQMHLRFKNSSGQIANELAHNLWNELVRFTDVNVRNSYVDPGKFLASHAEHELLLDEMRRVQANPNLTQLGLISINSIVDVILEKRLTEYRLLWLDDLRAMDDQKCIYKLPRRVHYYWKGREETDMQSLVFITILLASLTSFSVIVRKALNATEIS